MQGFMRFLTLVSVSPALDGCQLSPIVEISIQKCTKIELTLILVCMLDIHSHIVTSRFTSGSIMLTDMVLSCPFCQNMV